MVDFLLPEMDRMVLMVRMAPVVAEAEAEEVLGKIYSLFSATVEALDLLEAEAVKQQPPVRKRAERQALSLQHRDATAR